MGFIFCDDDRISQSYDDSRGSRSDFARQGATPIDGKTRRMRTYALYRSTHSIVYNILQ
jgi:hypothetical protein